MTDGDLQSECEVALERFERAAEGGWQSHDICVAAGLAGGLKSLLAARDADRARIDALAPLATAARAYAEAFNAWQAKRASAGVEASLTMGDASCAAGYVLLDAALAFAAAEGK